MASSDELPNMDGLQTMGIINALKTGNVHLDLIIAMSIPVILRFLFSNMQSLGNTVFSWTFWANWWAKKSGYHERFLISRSIVETGGSYGSSQSSLDMDTQNAVLIKAIKLYVHSKCKLELDAANLDLTSAGTDNGDYDSDDDSDEDGPTTLVGTLSEYKILKIPLSNTWHIVGMYGHEEQLHEVELQVIESEDTVGSKEAERQRSTLTYHLRSEGSTSIDDFVERAYNWYLDELRKLEDNSRHFYELQKVESEDEGGSVNYKRYKLSNEKTFESLFFKQKDMLLDHVNHFTEKTGKYAIKGYPHKLGLLMHGPPGTGKTSMIKALAQHTGRSIVNVSLSKIATNTELQSVFFDNRYHIQGEYVPVKLGFKDVIFVLEDVDAASNVVKRRDGKNADGILQVENVDLPPAKSIWRMLLESSDDDCQELVTTLIDKSERLMKEAIEPKIQKSLASGMSKLPGLSLVGSTDKMLARLGAEALETAESTLDGQEMIDRFLSMHVKPLKALLENGAELDEILVDELLSIPGASAPVRAREASRESSYEHNAGTDQSVPEVFLKEGIEQVAGPNIGLWLDGETKGDYIGDKTGSDKAKKLPSPFNYLQKDRLNLTGLLNVLDGVVDTPGRMLIMTTNHPEKLDPALIRPGRMDKKILLGYMAAADVTKMLEHYFIAELNNTQRMRVDEAIHGNPSAFRPPLNLTPAQVEQLAAEHDDLEDMIRALEEKGRTRRYHDPAQAGRRKRSYSKVSFGV